MTSVREDMTRVKEKEKALEKQEKALAAEVSKKQDKGAESWGEEQGGPHVIPMAPLVPHPPPRFDDPLTSALQSIGAGLQSSLQAVTNGLFKDPVPNGGPTSAGSPPGFFRMHVMKPLFSPGPVTTNLGGSSSFLNEDPTPIPAPQVVAIRIGDE